MDHTADNDALEMDLPGMWSLSDFTGGDPDERSYAARGWALRCDNCGRFASYLHPIPCNPPTGGIDREVCRRCVTPFGVGG
jgi:hypothetical protein